MQSHLLPGYVHSFRNDLGNMINDFTGILGDILLIGELSYSLSYENKIILFPVLPQLWIMKELSSLWYGGEIAFPKIESQIFSEITQKMGKVP